MGDGLSFHALYGSAKSTDLIKVLTALGCDWTTRRLSEVNWNAPTANFGEIRKVDGAIYLLAVVVLRYGRRVVEFLITQAGETTFGLWPHQLYIREWCFWFNNYCQ